MFIHINIPFNFNIHCFILVYINMYVCMCKSTYNNQIICIFILIYYFVLMSHYRHIFLYIDQYIYGHVYT